MTVRCGGICPGGIDEGRIGSVRGVPHVHKAIVVLMRLRGGDALQYRKALLGRIDGVRYRELVNPCVRGRLEVERVVKAPFGRHGDGGGIGAVTVGRNIFRNGIGYLLPLVNAPGDLDGFVVERDRLHLAGFLNGEFHRVSLVMAPRCDLLDQCVGTRRQALDAMRLGGRNPGFHQVPFLSENAQGCAGHFLLVGDVALADVNARVVVFQDDVVLVGQAVSADRSGAIHGKGADGRVAHKARGRLCLMEEVRARGQALPYDRALIAGLRGRHHRALLGYLVDLLA